MDKQKKEEESSATGGSSGGSSGGKEECSELKELFESYCKCDKDGDGKSISLESVSKWMEAAGLIGGKTQITDAEVEAVFSKHAKSKKRLDYSGFQEFITDLAKEKKMEEKELCTKLKGAKKPSCNK